MQCEVVIHEYAQMSLLLWSFKDILFEVAYAKIGGTVEGVPFVPTGTRKLFHVLNLGAVRNFLATLPPAAVSSPEGTSGPLSIEVMATYFPITIAGQSCRMSK